MSNGLSGFETDKVTVPTYPQYTNEALGEGVFDQLMKAVKVHLDSQFDENRITGPQYAEVYVQAIQAVLQNSTAYLLGILFTDEERAKIIAETSLIGKQEEEIDGKLRLIDLEETKLKYEMEQILPLRKEELEATVANLLKQGELIDAQITKIEKELEVMSEQILNSQAQRSKMEAEEAYLLKQGQLIDKQIDKMAQEILLMAAKVATEQANTQVGVADPGSLIGKQISLLAAQKLAFSGDIRSKMAKLHADYASVYQSVYEATPTAANLDATTKTELGKAHSVADDIERA